MATLEDPLSSFPSRRIEMDELQEFKETDRILAIIHDEQMIDVEGPYAFVWNCVFITETVSAVVYIEDEKTWYRIYNKHRQEAVLTDAYDTIREMRDEDSLFERHALSVSEAIFNANRPSGDETSGYEKGDPFDCPVCEETHTVQFHQDEIMENHDIDSSELYVECPRASGDKLYVEFQANTSSDFD
jgi:hypothetical protein